MKSYHEIMAEPLPSSLDFGFDGNAADLAAESVRFGSTRGYVEFQIALCEWQMRRDCAELLQHGKHGSGYGEWVLRNIPWAIKDEQERLLRYRHELEEMIA